MGFLDNRRSLLLDIIRLATQADSVEQLDAIIDGPLKTLLGYEVMVCGTGFWSESGSYGYRYYSHHFPIEYFFDLRNPTGGIDSPLMARWRETQKPVWFESGRDNAAFPAEWVELFNRYDLRNIIGHATLDRLGVVGQYFVFARLSSETGPEQAEMLELVTPSLSIALARALESEGNEDAFAGGIQALISKRQRDILQWIYHGKTNWEISKILDINEETVKYHVDQAMSKLNVKTRAQAVGRALEIGAISPIKRMVNTEPLLKKKSKAVPSKLK